VTSPALPLRLLARLSLALRFLTRLPIPGPPLAPGDLGGALAFFPVPGAVLGLLLLGAAELLAERLAPGVAAALLVACLAWLTGGLHLDGAADTADGLSGGRGDRARTLEIMRDSRIGAHGAATVAALLVAKTVAVAELLGRGETWALVAAPALARFAAVPLVVLFPYARPEGLGRSFRDGSGARELAVAAALTLAIVAPLGARTAAPAAAALAAAVVLALLVWRRLGGLTGDVYGAAIELAELAFLVVAGVR
jgi:adenosylcobinamide-GDP ribazoletransferase